MNQVNGSSYEDFARQSLTSDPHYLTALTSMADHKAVVADEDIYAVGGLKLMSKDSQVSSAVRERLIRHKLLKPIDQSLRIDDGVDPRRLGEDLVDIAELFPFLQTLARQLGGHDALRQRAARLPLPTQLAFKLTVAREEKPLLYEHLLAVALIAVFLAAQLDLDQGQRDSVLLAALAHDIGELHIDPAVLDQQHNIGNDERQHLYVHPITGYLIVHEIAGLSPNVALAVLQHQERLDGSGYPYGKRGEAIGLFGRIIAIADVSASILTRFGNDVRLSMLLRLNRQKYDPRLLDLLQAHLHPGYKPSAASLPQQQLRKITILLHKWDVFHHYLGSHQAMAENDLVFIFERIAGLRHIMLQFGFDPDSLEALLQIAEQDKEVALELSTALDEVSWQFADLAHEIERHWGNITPTLPELGATMLADWLRDIQDQRAFDN